MYQIVVPIDFSENSKAGLHFTHFLVNKLKASATVIGIAGNGKVTNEITRPPSPSEKAFVEAKMHPPDTNTVVIEAHHPADTIIREFGKMQPDLIVIGGNPEKDTDHWLHTKETEILLRKARCPVIFTSINIDPEQVSDITFFLPLISDESYPQSGILSDMIKLAESKVHLLTVIGPNVPGNYTSIRKLEKIAEDFSLSDYSINTTINADMMNGLQFFNQKKKPDMVVIASGKNSRYIMLDFFIHALKNNTSNIFCKF